MRHRTPEPRALCECRSHPIEMMVSVFFCIADPKVCPVRAKFLGSHVPVNDTISSLDKFVLSGVRRQGSTPDSILQRSEKLAHFMLAFRRDWRATTHAEDGTRRTCGDPILIHSKYEEMVSNFTVWAKRLIGPLTGSAYPSQQRGLLSMLLERYVNDFVPDGKHKKTLRTGGNIAKLRSPTLRHLMRIGRVKRTLSGLSYDWLGHDARSEKATRKQAAIPEAT
jgi:hypothetical protein